MKHCSGCKKDKAIVEFGKDRSNNDGLTHRCKTCRNPQSKAWRDRNPEKVKETNIKYKEYRENYYSKEERKRKYKDANLKYSFGITLEQYEKMLLEQNGVCKICKNPETSGNNQKTGVSRLAVDHCHETGKIRSLLCGKCNRSLGLLEENISVLERMIGYIRGELL